MSKRKSEDASEDIEPVVNSISKSKMGISDIIGDIVKNKPEKIIKKGINYDTIISNGGCSGTTRLEDVIRSKSIERTHGKWVSSQRIYDDVLMAVQKLDMNDAFPSKLIVSRNTLKIINKIKYPLGLPYWWVLGAIFGKSLSDPKLSEFIVVTDIPDSIAVVSGGNDFVVIEID
jgi:hypothetical protein